MELSVKSLNKEELVDLLSTAAYGNGNYIYFSIPNESRDLVKEGSVYIEEKLADILLNGGDIEIVDVASGEAEPEEKDIEDKNKDVVYGKNYVDVYLNDDFGFNCVAYKVNMKNIIDGLNNTGKEGIECLIQALGEDGDVYDAYYTFQYALFEEVIYG